MRDVVVLFCPIVIFCYFSSYFYCSRLVLYFSFVFFLRTSSVGLRGVRWQISSFSSLFLVEQSIRGIGHSAYILFPLTSSFSMTI